VHWKSRAASPFPPGRQLTRAASAALLRLGDPVAVPGQFLYSPTVSKAPEPF
jgi:hypothetical protein